MNKSELVASIAEKSGLTKKEGRNPRNPEEVIKIPASKAPVFRSGKALKEAVNK